MLIEPTWQNCTHLNQLFRLFEANGFQLYVVGGWVRDTILQKSTQDLDLATDATPQQIVDFIGPAGIRHKPVGIEFGSILLGPTMFVSQPFGKT